MNHFSSPVATEDLQFMLVAGATLFPPAFFLSQCEYIPPCLAQVLSHKSASD